MRGPVGLLAPTDQTASLVDLAVQHEGATLSVHIDPRFLVPPTLKQGRLLFNVEGHGRFWLVIPAERGEGTAGPTHESAPVKQGE
jgi:hypothetical protein